MKRIFWFWLFVILLVSCRHPHHPVPIPPPIVVPPPVPVPVPIPDLPPIPTREQVLGVQETFQGLTVHTEQYGDLPWFDCGLSALGAMDRALVYGNKRDAGDTHAGLCLSWRYAEPGQAYVGIPGQDLSNNLERFRAFTEELIRQGFIPVLFLAGDGNSNPARIYNDPVGWTYGYEWLIENLPRIVQVLQGPPDLTPYCLFVPGFDGVFYGWEPSNVKVPTFGRVFRSLLPGGYLAIEHNTGHIPIGNGPGDWGPGRPMGDYDALLSEFDGPPTGDQVWQVAARSLGPLYHRPADQPRDDDPHPPCYLCAGTQRGPVVSVAFEWDEYRWVRGRVSLAEIQRERAYLKALGYQYVD